MVTTKVQFGLMLERLLGKVGNDNQIDFTRLSWDRLDKCDYRAGDWCYEFDHTFLINLCCWFDTESPRCEQIQAFVPILTPADEAWLETALRDAVAKILEDEDSD